MGGTVTLQIYDLHDNTWLYWAGIGEACWSRSACLDGPLSGGSNVHPSPAAVAGIFHSGVEVYNVEYAYGGVVGLLCLASRLHACGGSLQRGCKMLRQLALFAGHEYDMSGVFATNPRDAPGPGEILGVAAIPVTHRPMTLCSRAAEVVHALTQVC